MQEDYLTGSNRIKIGQSVYGEPVFEGDTYYYLDGKLIYPFEVSLFAKERYHDDIVEYLLDEYHKVVEEQTMQWFLEEATMVGDEE